MADGVETENSNWVLKKSNEYLKCYVNWEGSQINSELPLLRAIYYFRDIDDHRLI